MDIEAGLIDLLHQVQKYKTLEKFLDDVEPERNAILGTGLPSPYMGATYQTIRDVCSLRATTLLKQAKEATAVAKAYLQHPKDLYERFATVRTKISNEAILDFVKDYEKANNIKPTKQRRKK